MRAPFLCHSLHLCTVPPQSQSPQAPRGEGSFRAGAPPPSLRRVSSPWTKTGTRTKAEAAATTVRQARAAVTFSSPTLPLPSAATRLRKAAGATMAPPGALHIHAEVAASPAAAGDVAHLPGHAAVLQTGVLRTEGDGSSGDPCPGDTLRRAAIKVLRTADPHLKARRGELAGSLWRSGAIRHVCRVDVDADGGDLVEHPAAHVAHPSGDVATPDEFDLVPDEPARDAQLQCVAPKDMPKRGRGGSLQSRRALVHSLVHIESCAVDLSWDIIARFCASERMPRAFYDDFVRIALDEGRHFALLAERLEGLGSRYGALPVHQGLWETAAATSGSLLARLALEHCVHEARGLDVVPQTIARFRSGGDEETATLLEDVIYPEEITHCAAGVRWFTYICHRDGLCRDSPAAELRSSSGGAASSEAVGGEGREGKEGKPTEGPSPLQSESESAQGRCDQEQEPGAAPSGHRADRGTPPAHQRGQTEANQGAGQADDPWGWERVLALRSHPAVVRRFHTLVREHFRGALKPPFNRGAREEAGFAEEWYLPLAEKDARGGLDAGVAS